MGPFPMLSPPGRIIVSEWVFKPNAKVQVLAPTHGYFKNPEAIKLAIDIGYFNEDGQLFVVDRMKEFIKPYGFQVTYP